MLQQTKVNMQLSEKAILVKLSISLPGNTRTDANITAETILKHAMGAKAGRWLKQLYPDEAMTPLVRLSGEIRTWHYEHSLPWTDEGYRILPTAHHGEYTDKMREFRRAYESARDTFIDRLPEWIDWARQAHNGTFDISNYPEPEKLARKFGFGLDFSPIPSGADFRCEVSQEDIDAMAQQVNERVELATNAARLDLWQRLEAPIKAMADKLAEPDRADGKAPIFRDSLVGNLRAIVDLIPALNVTSDPALATFAEEVRSKLTACEPDTLRESKATRDQTAKAAADILSRMSGYFATTN